MKNAKWLWVLLPVALMAPMGVVARRHQQARTQMLFRLAFEGKNNQQMIHWLRLGANPNVTLSIGQPARYNGYSHPHNGYSALDYAIISKDSKLLQACFDAHADVNFRNAYGYPPLATAIIDSSEGCYSVTHTEVAILLLNHGANPNVSYERGTPLTDATIYNADASFRLIPLLLQKGANPLQRNWRGLTAYDMLALFLKSRDLTERQKKECRRVMALLKTAMKKRGAHS